MIEKSRSYGDLEELIEMALNEIEVAPSLRERGRQNLRNLAHSEGVGAITRKIEEAQARKGRAHAWLYNVSPPQPDIGWKMQQARKLDPSVIQQQAWGALARLAQKRPGKTWARFVSNAAARLATLDELSVRADVDGAESACIDLIAAAEAPDFQHESNVIRGAVFAETANLYTICAKVTRERTFVERGLFLYNVAANTLSRGKYPLALLVVQINRGAALNCYAHLIQTQYLEKYTSDINEVVGFLENEINQPDHNNEYRDIAQSVHQSLEELAEFNKSVADWNNWSQLGNCSMNMVVDNEIEQLIQISN